MQTASIFDFSQDIVLEDDRALIRPLELSDHKHLAGFAIHEPEIWKYSLVRIAGEDDMVKYLSAAVEARAAKKEFPFIIYDKQQQQYAGCTRFYDIQLNYQALSLGYTWYGKQFQGTGLNKHCKLLLFDFAFNAMHMERIELRADYRNARSIAAMKGVGCSVEGILRSNMPTFEGPRRDSIVLSVLAEEWRQNLRENLKQKL
ncbi:MAG: GNAT family N-acetyltransferase [Chitinophagaceae bacterium]|nr:GNAT family N-acetyltransferase [Chitinophagaceae bacterium]